jgi:hypothetical protein
MTVWDDPETVRKMSESFFRGQQFGYLADGLVNNMPDGVKEILGQASATLQQAVGTPSIDGKNGDGPRADTTENASPPSELDGD